MGRRAAPGCRPGRLRGYLRRHRKGVVAFILIAAFLSAAAFAAYENDAFAGRRKTAGQQTAENIHAIAARRGGSSTAGPSLPGSLPMLAGGGYTWTRSQLIGMYIATAAAYVPHWSRDDLIGLYIITAGRYVPHWSRDDLIGLYIITAPRYVPSWRREDLVGAYIITAPRYVPNWNRDNLVGAYIVTAERYVPHWDRDDLVGLYIQRAPRYYGDP